jgi:hypothetical protein
VGDAEAGLNAPFEHVTVTVLHICPAGTVALEKPEVVPPSGIVCPLNAHVAAGCTLHEDTSFAGERTPLVQVTV